MYLRLQRVQLFHVLCRALGLLFFHDRNMDEGCEMYWSSSKGGTLCVDRFYLLSIKHMRLALHTGQAFFSFELRQFTHRHALCTRSPSLQVPSISKEKPGKSSHEAPSTGSSRGLGLPRPFRPFTLSDNGFSLSNPARGGRPDREWLGGKLCCCA